MVGLLKMRRLSDNCLFFNRYRDLSITICSCFIVIIFTVFFVVSVSFKFDFVSSYSGFVVKEDKYYVVLYINDNELQNIKKNVLVVDNVKFNYNIHKISDEYVVSNSGPVRMVYLDFDLDESYKIVNNVLKLNFVSKKTFFKYVKERLL